MLHPIHYTLMVTVEVKLSNFPYKNDKSYREICIEPHTSNGATCPTKFTFHHGFSLELLKEKNLHIKFIIHYCVFLITRKMRL